MSILSLGSKWQFQPGSWAELLYELAIGMAVGCAHSSYLVARFLYRMISYVPLMLLRFRENTSRTDPPTITTESEKRLKVVAVGYGRTGTVRAPSFFF
jgi:hypothetical protein